MSVGRHRDDGAEARRERLLAVSGLRRDLERRSKSRVKRRRSMAVSTNELESLLEELIAALDRRVPRVEQAGEAAIARDAAALRAKAVKRLTELVRDSVRLPTPAADPP
jgi:hypothetical protein